MSPCRRQNENIFKSLYKHWCLLLTLGMDGFNIDKVLRIKQNLHLISYITYLCTTLSSNTKIRQSLIIKKLFIPVCLSLICSSCILAVNLMGILYLNNNFPRSFNKYFSVLKSNVESQDNIHSIVKSLNNFERMIRFWLNKTSEESYENEFDWKRKKLKDFLNQK